MLCLVSKVSGKEENECWSLTGEGGAQRGSAGGRGAGGEGQETVRYPTYPCSPWGQDYGILHLCAEPGICGHANNNKKWARSSHITDLT